MDLPLGLANELRDHQAASLGTGPNEPAFASGPRNGRQNRMTPDNVGRRLKTVIRRANEALAKTEIESISERVSPHSLRRTNASLRAALHQDPVYIAEQLGHTDPTFSLRVYSQAGKAALLSRRLYRAMLNAKGALFSGLDGLVCSPQRRRKSRV